MNNQDSLKLKNTKIIIFKNFSCLSYISAYNKHVTLRNERNLEIE